MPEIGQSISHYKILDKLGAGGMGEVSRAQDTNLNRQVAIGVLPDVFSGDPERLARFEREAGDCLSGIAQGHRRHPWRECA